MKVQIIEWNTKKVINTAESILGAVEFIKANDFIHVITFSPDLDVFVIPERKFTTLVTYVVPKGEIEE